MFSVEAILARFLLARLRTTSSFVNPGPATAPPPVAEVSWGTPTLVTALFGVLIQFPTPLNFILLGTIHTAVPSEEQAVVVLNLDIVGMLLPDEERLSIDASLRDSRIIRFPLAGDFALRLSWGSDPNFRKPPGKYVVAA